MNKIIALAAVFLMVAGMSTAVDRHGPMKTGLFEVQIDDVEVKGWQSVTIPGVSVEQGDYREGNDASDEETTQSNHNIRYVEENVIIETENGKDVNIIQEKTGVADPDVTDEFGNPVPVTLEWSTSEGDAGEYTLTIFMPDGTPVRAKTVTIPGKSIEQDEYRDGNDATHEKKTWGQVTFDDLEMERGVKLGATELHDWIKDIQAGKADEGRKEIAVKLLDEEQTATAYYYVRRRGGEELAGPGEGGKTVGAGQVTEILELAGNGDGNGDEVSEAARRVVNEEGVDASQETSARKGRNPQTGEEIQIPARTVANADTTGNDVEAWLLTVERAQENGRKTVK